MAVIQFNPAAPEKKPEDLEITRRLLHGDEARLLLGDLFLRIAAAAPANCRTPHQDLLKKMLGSRDIPWSDTLLLLMRNLDSLRARDLAEKRRISQCQAEGSWPHGFDESGDGLE